MVPEEEAIRMSQAMQEMKKNINEEESILEKRERESVDDESSSWGEKRLKDSSDSDFVKGRFSENEKQMLFDIIRDDAILFSAFLHRKRNRMYGTKSWMHEICHRFNQKSKQERTLEAIRHHLVPRNLTRDTDLFDTLRQHAARCELSSTCSKCLLFQQCCVSEKHAKCGFDKCRECKTNLPSVHSLLNEGGVLLPPQQPQNQEKQMQMHPQIIADMRSNPVFQDIMIDPSQLLNATLPGNALMTFDNTYPPWIQPRMQHQVTTSQPLFNKYNDLLAQSLQFQPPMVFMNNHLAQQQNSIYKPVSVLDSATQRDLYDKLPAILSAPLSGKSADMLPFLGK